MTGPNEPVPDAKEVLEKLSAAVGDEEFMTKLVVYTTSLLNGYAAMGGSVPTGLGAAEGIVGNVVADTAKGALGDSGRGALSWNPSAAPLLVHLRRAVSNKVRDLRKHAQRYPQLNPADASGSSGAVPSAPRDVAEEVEDADFTEKRVEALMALAEERGYEDVYFLLVAAKDGVRGTTNFVIETGLSQGQVYRGWAKARRLLEELPEQLRSDDDTGRG